MLRSSEFYHQILGLQLVQGGSISLGCIRYKGNVFIIQEMYYPNQIAFQPKNTHVLFEINEAPWRFLGYSGCYSLNITVNTHFLTTIIIIYL